MPNFPHIPVERLIGTEYGVKVQGEVSERKCSSGKYSPRHAKHVDERNYGKLTGLEEDNNAKETSIEGRLTRKHSASYFHSDYI